MKIDLGELIKKITWRPQTLWRLMTPDVSREQRAEMARAKTLAAAREVIIEEARRQQARVLAALANVAKTNAAIEHKAVDGLGEKIATIPIEAYFQMKAMYGEDCWNDPDFMRAFLRDNPQCRVKVTRGTRGQEYSQAGSRDRGAGRNGNGAVSREHGAGKIIHP